MDTMDWKESGDPVSGIGLRTQAGKDQQYFLKLELIINGD